MAKGIREKIKLESTAGTGHFYTTTKNKRNMPEKMLIKKFDPVARKHVEYKETKLTYSGLAPRLARWYAPARQCRMASLFQPRPGGVFFLQQPPPGLRRPPGATPYNVGFAQPF